jgi:hypothetical protein
MIVTKCWSGVRIVRGLHHPIIRLLHMAIGELQRQDATAAAELTDFYGFREGVLDTDGWQNGSADKLHATIC